MSVESANSCSQFSLGSTLLVLLYYCIAPFFTIHENTPSVAGFLVIGEP